MLKTITIVIYKFLKLAKIRKICIIVENWESFWESFWLEHVPSEYGTCLSEHVTKFYVPMTHQN